MNDFEQGTKKDTKTELQTILFMNTILLLLNSISFQNSVRIMATLQAPL